MRDKNDTILAIDPGLQELGYALLSGKRLLASGVLPFRSIPANKRLLRVREEFKGWVRAYRPKVLVIEQIPGRPLDTLAGLPALGRLLRRLARRHRLQVATYSAKAVRRGVVGNGWAGKREVAELVCARFPELRVFRTHDRKWKEAYWQNMSDAIALGLFHQILTKQPSRSR